MKKLKVVLDLSSQEMETFSGLNFKLYPGHNFQLLIVLILRDNYISNLSSMNLRKLAVLTDLDLAYNKLKGRLPSNVFPLSLERLDITGNDFDNLSGLINCTKLKTLNASQNKIKLISTYPISLTNLDLSYNLIMNITDLRVLSLSPGITVLNVIGNPVSNNTLCRVTVCTALPKLLSLDEYIIPGRGTAKKNTNTTSRRSSDLLSIDDRSIASKNLMKTDAVRTKVLGIKKSDPPTPVSSQKNDTVRTKDVGIKKSDPPTPVGSQKNDSVRTRDVGIKKSDPPTPVGLQKTIQLVLKF